MLAWFPVSSLYMESFFSGANEGLNVGVKVECLESESIFFSFLSVYEAKDYQKSEIIITVGYYYSK